MSDLLELAVLAAQAVAGARPSPPRVRPWRMIAGAAGIGLCLLLATGFLVAALWLALSPLVGALATALILAGLALVQAAAIALLLRHWTRHPQAEPQAAPAPDLVAAAGRLMTSHKGTALLAALAAGITAGAAEGHRPTRPGWSGTTPTNSPNAAPPTPRSAAPLV